jgi:hypothetical protein
MSIVCNGGVGHDHHCRVQQGREGTDIIARPSAQSFPEAADPEDRCHRTTALLRSRQSSFFVGVVLPPLGRLDRNMLVNEQRAPFPGATSRLSAANSNTLHLSLIHPYPLRQKYFTDYGPASLSG